jgi:hypothetical protein
VIRQELNIVKNKIAVMLACAVAMAVGGCETEYPQLGSAVTNMVQAQTLDPATAANPAPLAPEGADGQRIKNAMDVYHKDVARDRQDVERSLTFDAGTNK